MRVDYDCTELRNLRQTFTYVLGHELGSTIAIGIAVPILDGVVQGVIRSCSGRLFS